jgi:hypothetical protein
MNNTAPLGAPRRRSGRFRVRHLIVSRPEDILVKMDFALEHREVRNPETAAWR